MKVGIPRALYYYKYYPLWRSFFCEMGAETIVSGYTSKRLIDLGIKNCVDEACLPVKLFHGHVEDLKNRVDYLFIPRLTSVSKNEYICPKIGGLPDMVRNSVKGLPPLIDTEVNMIKKKKDSIKAALKTGRHISVNRKQILDAYRVSVNCFREYRQKVKKMNFPGNFFDERVASQIRSEDGGFKILLIGHPYTLYDNYLNMNIVKKIHNYGYTIVTPDMYETKTIVENCRSLSKKMFWNFGTQSLGCAIQGIKDVNTKGIIYLMGFGCGIDSFICDFVERRVRKESIKPFTVITIDEHTGEAGMNTRIEAFMDMVEWRKNGSYIPSYG